MSDGWNGRRVTAARAALAARTTWPTPCGRCNKPVQITDQWVLGHVVARSLRPDLMWEPSNHRVECRACSDASSQAAVIEKARAEGARDALADRASVFSGAGVDGKTPDLPVHTHGRPSEPLVIREELCWAPERLAAYAWTAWLLPFPDEASMPLAMSPVHPEAVGSYGPEAIEWMESNLTERGRPLRFRFWQALAICRQLEHRADGSLCWRTVVESTPRRSGKSTRLRAVALWRLAVGPDLFEPDQLVLHTGKDLAIVREVLRKAWPWADARKDDGWDCKRGMTEPEVSYHETNRWVARSKDSTTGYDVCAAMVDEAWDVPPSSIDDDLEPAMLERVSPQLLLTSTAHRRATSLMRGRIAAALAAEDDDTLLLWWGALPGSDPGDPEAWRAASPYWSEDRAKTIAAKYAKALAGEADPEFDDPDPMAGFVCQYLNVWPLREGRRAAGTPVVAEDAWAELVQPAPGATPAAAAIESWPGDDVSLALAWAVEDGVLVSVSDHPDVASTAAALRATGYRRQTIVGASLSDDPALRGLRVTKGTGRTGEAVSTLSRMLGSDQLRHDGGEHLSAQVLGVRTTPSADGLRLVSKKRADAVKAAAWAASAVLRSSGAKRARIILPRSA